MKPLERRNSKKALDSTPPPALSSSFSNVLIPLGGFAPSSLKQGGHRKREGGAMYDREDRDRLKRASRDRFQCTSSPSSKGHEQGVAPSHIGQAPPGEPQVIDGWDDPGLFCLPSGSDLSQSEEQAFSFLCESGIDEHFSTDDSRNPACVISQSNIGQQGGGSARYLDQSITEDLSVNIVEAENNLFIPAPLHIGHCGGSIPGFISQPSLRGSTVEGGEYPRNLLGQRLPSFQSYNILQHFPVDMNSNAPYFCPQENAPAVFRPPVLAQEMPIPDLRSYPVVPPNSIPERQHTDMYPPPIFEHQCSKEWFPIENIPNSPRNLHQSIHAGEPLQISAPPSLSGGRFNQFPMEYGCHDPSLRPYSNPGRPFAGMDPPSFERQSSLEWLRREESRLLPYAFPISIPGQPLGLTFPPPFRRQSGFHCFGGQPDLTLPHSPFQQNLDQILN